MQEQAHIASAFAAWQRAHQRLCDAEEKLAAATDAWQQGRQPRPDALYNLVVSLKAEQDWRYDDAADALRSRRSTAPAPLNATPAPVRRGGSAPQAAA